MRKNFGARPLCYPQPVFIIATYDEDGTPDAMNAAWGGISESDEITLCLSAGHKTVKNLLKRGAFTISMATAKALTSTTAMAAHTVPQKVKTGMVPNIRTKKAKKKTPYGKGANKLKKRKKYQRQKCLPEFSASYCLF